MKAINVSQLVLFFVVCFLLFGDLQNFKKKVKTLIKQIKQLF